MTTMQIENKKVVVAGLGKSGLATARFLVRRGASVVVTDQAGEDKLGAAAASARELGVTLELGGHRDQTFLSADFIVVSPGVPSDLLPLVKAGEKGIPVIGEIELAARFVTKSMAAVTGTNGKTTVTTLLGDMLRVSGQSVFVGGNIGTPLIEFVDEGEKADTVVLEVSSFQLDTIETFRPKVAVLLNIAEDHLARYVDFDAYVRSKGRIFENQTETDVAVLNGADFHVLQAAKGIRSRKLTYNGGRNTKDGALIGEKTIEIVEGGDQTAVISVASPLMRARHNMENIAATILAALAMGATVEGVQAAVDGFKGLRHRLEYVTSIGDVHFFDDSKATNPDAVRRALEFFTCRVVLLLGGEDKGCDYGVLKNAIRERARAVVLFGAAKEKIRVAINGSVSLWEADSMAAAVRRAYDVAEPGDAVLLSPACSSFDMYKSYAHRGDDFCDAARALKEEKA
ncbi:MAG: UDP-N-acetylmuramoyl-L-alanine--D-glutamate ligase [Thermodesulfobacteriota bacterium]